MVNYVLETTGQTELFYVGHSQGTVMGFAGFTVNQTLAKQIKAFFALAPVTTVKHAKGLFAFIGEKLIIETIKVRSLELGPTKLAWLNSLDYSSALRTSNNFP